MNFFGSKQERDDFLPSVTALISGTTAAMAITYVVRPILTRIYSPDMFGLLGFFTAIVAVLTTISSGRYDDAVMLPEDEAKSRHVVVLSAVVLVGLTLLLTPVAALRYVVADAIGKPEIAPYLSLIPLSLLFMGTIRLSEVWLTRQKRFRAIAGGRATLSATSAPIQLAAGLRSVSPWGLIGGLVSGQAVAAVVVGSLAWKDLRETSLPNLAQLRSLARRYRNFPLFSGPSAVLNSMSSQLPAFLLFVFFDTAVVGYYAQAYALLAVPIGLVGSSVAQVYFEKAARLRSERGLGELTETVFRRLVEIGMLPTLLILAAGPQLVQFVLGSDWATAGEYAQWMAVWLLLLFVSSPLTRLFDVLERLKANLVFNVLLFAARVVVLLAAGFAGEPLLAVALYAVVSAILYLGLLFWLLVLGDVKVGRSIGFLARTFAVGIVPAAMVWIAGNQYAPAFVFATACGAGILYVAILFTLPRFGSRKS